jgi:hypothetical protein
MCYSRLAVSGIPAEIVTGVIHDSLENHDSPEKRSEWNKHRLEDNASPFD